MALELNEAPVTRSQGMPGVPSWRLFKPKLTATDRIFFTEQLELLLDTGVNLHAALTTLKGQSTSTELRKLLEELCNVVAGGKPFSEALAQHPDVFPANYVNLVGAAESGGFLPAVLRQLLEMDEKRENLRSTLVSALTYPAFLAVFSLAVVIFILVVVFPKFGKLFVSIKDQLPATTLALMWVSDMLRQHWAVVTGGLGIMAYALRQFLISKAGRLQVDRLKLHMPVIRDIFMPVYLIQILRTMGMSLGNGVSIVNALHGCRDIIDNRSICAFLSEVEARVRQGTNFSDAFREGSFVPPLVKQMIMTGDETGNLGKVMIRVAEYYERELDKRLQKFSKIAEPVMLLVMGVVVGVLVSSLILPIFKLTRAVH